MSTQIDLRTMVSIAPEFAHPANIIPKIKEVILNKEQIEALMSVIGSSNILILQEGKTLADIDVFSLRLNNLNRGELTIAYK